MTGEVLTSQAAELVQPVIVYPLTLLLSPGHPIELSSQSSDFLMTFSSLALELEIRFLCELSSHFYEDNDPVSTIFEHGRLTSFKGAKYEVHACR